MVEKIKVLNLKKIKNPYFVVQNYYYVLISFMHDCFYYVYENIDKKLQTPSKSLRGP